MLNDASLSQLQSVFAPRMVGVPPTNAVHDLMLLPDGEIRHYGFRGDFSKGPALNVFLRSVDHGFSWSEHVAPPNCAGATVRSPWSGNYLTVVCWHGESSLEEFQSIHLSCSEPGLYVRRSVTGPDGPFISKQVGDLLPRMITPRQPLALRHRRRWVLPAHADMQEPYRPSAVVYLSDDDGESWRLVTLPAVPPFGVKWPHAGPRWENCGSEPTIAELSDGRLHMLIRTAHDEFWESFSEDGGETWTTPAPSRFYGTITTPLLFSLSDGRLLAVWNNTTPLPEVDHALQPGLSDAERNGIWEDRFTNRDALHAAISSDDGKTWSGFRELYLNERRNDSDYRSHGGNEISIDKSIHQSQAVELPGGKVLLAFGQHPDCRRMILFDPNWLLETERSDDFRFGLDGWSTHQYLKSVPGNYRGFSGHCSLNRRPGAALVPHPGGEMREVLQIARHPDERLIEEREGAVWNFPSGMLGVVKLRICLPVGSFGTQIALLDRWFNPVDPVVASFSQFVLRIGPDGKINEHSALTAGVWHWLAIRWDLTGKSESFFSVDDGTAHSLALGFATRNGISYLHLQSLADEKDAAGLYVEKVEKCLCCPLQ